MSKNNKSKPLSLPKSNIQNRAASLWKWGRKYPSIFPNALESSRVLYAQSRFERGIEPMDYRNTVEYKIIKDLYKNDTTKRSGVPLMNHIDEGIAIMVERGASDRAIRAYIVHPVFQGDANLEEILNSDTLVDMNVVILAMEYRRTANSYLCKPSTDNWDLNDIGNAVGFLLPDVREMLIADKIQNQKDFRLYHYGTHARSDQLESYFIKWRQFLDA